MNKRVGHATQRCRKLKLGFKIEFLNKLNLLNDAQCLICFHKHGKLLKPGSGHSQESAMFIVSVLMHKMHFRSERNTIDRR
jgi:phosphoheptose isomerase